MNSRSNTIVDFVVKGDSHDEWKMVLVEEGPWIGSIDEELCRLQNRVYGCIDAAFDGGVFSSFPNSLGKRVVIQLDCYNVPRADVEDFFDRFSAGVFAAGEYCQALRDSKFVQSIGF